METKRKTIFREDAVRHYSSPAESETLSRFERPRRLWVIWFALLLAVTVSAVLMLVPLEISGKTIRVVDLFWL